MLSFTWQHNFHPLDIVDFICATSSSLHFCLKNAARQHTRCGHFDQDQYAGWQEFLAVGEVDESLQFQSQHLLKIFIGNVFFDNTAIFINLEIFIVVVIFIDMAIVISSSKCEL